MHEQRVFVVKFYQHCTWYNHKYKVLMCELNKTVLWCKHCNINMLACKLTAAVISIEFTLNETFFKSDFVTFLLFLTQTKSLVSLKAENWRLWSSSHKQQHRSWGEQLTSRGWSAVAFGLQLRAPTRLFCRNHRVHKHQTVTQRLFRPNPFISAQTCSSDADETSVCPPAAETSTGNKTSMTFIEKETKSNQRQRDSNKQIK